MNNTKESVESKEADNTAIYNNLMKFQQPSVWKSIWQIANSVIPYVALWWLAVESLQYSYWLTLPILILAAGFAIRIFIIFHDCGHGSLFKSERANLIVGIVTGIINFTPYHYWRNAHAKHHATTANLDKRGFGDVWMMTVSEFRNAPRIQRLKYRLYRHPLVMFGLGPLFLVLITHRFVRRDVTLVERLSIYGTNLAVALMVALMIWGIGLKAYLLIQIPMLFISLVAGIWLFYVQHQFEGVHWTRSDGWDHIRASIEGGSFYRLPAVLKWFTGNIGFHHIHHLNSRIPNYYLPKCQRQIPELDKAPTIGLWSSLKSLKFRLWDEENQLLVGFRALKSKLPPMQGN